MAEVAEIGAGDVGGSWRDRVEWWLAYLQAHSVADVPSFAGPIVANQAAATALPLSTYTTAREVYTLAQEAIWQYIPGVPGTNGVPPLRANEVILAAGGVLARTEYSSPKHRIGVNDVWIDPANVLASDENSGLTAALPLKTGYELFRRWGWNASKPIVGPNLTTSPDGFTTIHVQSDLATPDSLPIKVTAAANSNGLRVTAPLLPANIIATGVLTNAVVAMVPGAPLGGVRLTVRDNLIANWAAAEVPNRRVRMTISPTALGGTFQPQTDSLVVPGQVECSACQTTNEPGFAQTATTVTPAVGDTYVIEKLVVVNFGEIDIAQELNPGNGGFDAFVNIVNCNLPTTIIQSWTPKATSVVSINLYQCTIDRTLDISRANVVPIACYFTSSIFTQGGFGSVEIEGGGINGLATAGGAFIVLSSFSLNAAIDGDFVANGLKVFGVAGPVRNFASWNAVPAAGTNTAGHGVIVGGGGTGPFYGFRMDALFKGLCWGNGSPGVGLYVSAACKGVGAPQNITGATGDGQLANNASVGGNNVYWDAATGTYVGATGVAGVASNFTWALLGAVKAAPGYGFSVHFPDQDASFVAAETTA